MAGQSFPQPGGTPRLALNKTEAATALGVSVDFFDDHVAHEVRCVRRGRRRLYPLRELEQWLERAGERVTGNYSVGHVVLMKLGVALLFGGAL